MVDQKWIDAFPEYYGENAKDPDEGTGNIEVNDLITSYMSKLEGMGNIFNTWSERHAFIAGFTIGYTYNATDAPVPVFWYSDAHYFRVGMILGAMSRTAKPEEVEAALKFIGLLLK